ncbi:hypothetical protein PM082_024876 [Marasmius tenuissimus]|nr:hypothetical protein PM082_024876 [Marasmius tenuissimus]
MEMWKEQGMREGYGNSCGGYTAGGRVDMAVVIRVNKPPMNRFRRPEVTEDTLLAGGWIWQVSQFLVVPGVQGRKLIVEIVVIRDKKPPTDRFRRSEVMEDTLLVGGWIWQASQCLVVPGVQGRKLIVEIVVIRGNKPLMGTNGSLLSFASYGVQGGGVRAG